MKKNLKGLAAVAVAAVMVCLPSCAVQVERALRSGTLENDYIEEPISPSFSDFEPALRISNAILEAIMAEDYELISEQLVDPAMQGKITPDSLRSTMDKSRQVLGPMISYKPNQWGFVRKKDGAVDLLFSVKIVEHEGGLADYFFVFPDDGRLVGILGFFAKKKDGVRSPVEL